MVDESYEFHLSNLRKLYVDLEKQMLKFDEILPYERQKTSEIYSPRLLNMMLACCPQIEATTKLISQKCKFSEKSVPGLIQKINEKNVLSNFKIISIPHKLMFKPFTGELSWWNAYNKLKHELTENQFELTYSKVMCAFAALTALHHLADFLNTNNDEHVQQILDENTWTDEESLRNYSKQMAIYRREDRPTYKPLIFNVTTFLKPVKNF